MDIRNIHLEDFECPRCGQKTLYVSELDAEGLPNGTIECVSCGAEIHEAIDVQPVCEHEDCNERGYACYLPQSDEPDEYYCPQHAFESGYCKGCGQFWGGIERFGFGSGYCEHCEAEFDDDDYEDDDSGYYDFYHEWEDIVEGESGGRYIGPGSETLPDDEAHS